MAVKMGLVMKLAVLTFLLAAVSATARSVDLFDFLASNNREAFGLVKHKSKAEVGAEACCNLCICTKSYPPQCHCRDIFSDPLRCLGCDKCVCTFGIPPRCRCADINSYCAPECDSTAKSAAAEMATTVAVEAITSSSN